MSFLGYLTQPRLTSSRDIVDTEPWDGNMLKMLLGAFNPFFDGDGEKVSPEVGSPATKNG